MATPKTIHEIAQDNKITDSPSKYTAKIWTQTAVKLLELGELARQNNHLEACYSQTLKATSIILEVVIKCRDFNPQDPTYVEIRNRLIDHHLPLMEQIRFRLITSYEAFFRTRAVSCGDLIKELGQSFKDPRYRILILDFRLLVEYQNNHIVWSRHAESLGGGVVHIEPELINGCDIKSNMALRTTELYSLVENTDLVVIYDQSSNSPAPNSPFLKLIQLLKESGISAAILVGGFDAWHKFIVQGGYRLQDFIESGKYRTLPAIPNSGSPLDNIQKRSVSNQLNVKTGAGIGSSNIYSNAAVKPLNTTPESTGIIRSAYQVGLNATGLKAANVAAIGINNSSTTSYDTHPIPDLQNHYRSLSYPLSPAASQFANIGISRNMKNQNVNIKYDKITLQPEMTLPSFNAKENNQKTDDTLGRSSSRFSFNPGHSFSGNEENFNYSPTRAALRYPEIRVNEPPPIPIKPLLDARPELQPNPPPISLKNSALEIKRESLYTNHMNTSNFGKVPPALNFPALPLSSRSSPPLPPKSNRATNFSPRSASPSLLAITNRYFSPADSAFQPPPTLPPKPKGSIGYVEDSIQRKISSADLGATTMGVVGLKNLGNTCFMNSILQCLSGTVPLARYFLCTYLSHQIAGSFRRHINKSNPLGSRGVIAEAFAQLIKIMWSAEESVVTPVKFKQILGEHAPQFQGNDQQDSQEFLGFLLDAIHEDVNIARKSTIGRTEEDDEDPSRNWSRYIDRNWSIIVDMFQGQLRSQLQCLTCGKASISYNAFMYLSLPIPDRNKEGVKDGPLYIEDCLDKFVEIEILDGDDKWNCPRCKAPMKSSKTLTISKLPPFLMIHLKRFYHQGPFRNKVDTHVEFPLANLDLEQYHSGEGGSSRYDLYAVSNHYGGLNGGHYTAQVKNPYKNAWINFDDSRIGGTDNVRSKAAYIMFYVQKSQPGVDLVRGKWWNEIRP